MRFITVYICKELSGHGAVSGESRVRRIVPFNKVRVCFPCDYLLADTSWKTYNQSTFVIRRIPNVVTHELPPVPIASGDHQPSCSSIKKVLSWTCARITAVDTSQRRPRAPSVAASVDASRTLSVTTFGRGQKSSAMCEFPNSRNWNHNSLQNIMRYYKSSLSVY